MQQFSTQPAATVSAQKPAKLRLAPVVHLLSGEVVSAVAESQRQFEDRPQFGLASETVLKSANPAKWLAGQIEDLAELVGIVDTPARPLFLAAPLAAFSHSNTAIAADAAVRKTRLLAQEICLEFKDAAFVSGGTDCLRRVEALRRKGFRVSIDARQAWNSEPPRALHLLIDTIRVRADDIDACEDLATKIEIAAASGVAIIAEGARWRDGEMLANMGIDYGCRPRADA